MHLNRNLTRLWTKWCSLITVLKTTGFKKSGTRPFCKKSVGLELNSSAPLFFWPSRLDPVQKGCALLAEVMYEIITRYWDTGIQIVSVADGAYQKHFHDISDFHGLDHRISIWGFNEHLSHQAFAASDFLFMPSNFEPCGLPQLIGGIYGTLPIVFDTGGLHDTVKPLDIENSTGNGFLFNVHDAGGLKWAVDKAMEFYLLGTDEKNGRSAES